MNLNGALGDAEAERNPLVRESLSEELDDAPLPLGQ